jgi:hypothetical protein
MAMVAAMLIEDGCSLLTAQNLDFHVGASRGR